MAAESPDPSDPVPDAGDAWADDAPVAAALLREGLADQVDRDPPEGELQAAASRVQDAHSEGDPTAAWLRRAAGLDGDLATPDGERLVGGDLVLLLAAATIEPMADPGLDEDDEAALASLEPLDWVAVIVGLVRSGPGTPAGTDRLVTLVERGPGLPDLPPIDLEPGEAAVLAHGFELLAPAWTTLGVTGETGELTGLGAWLLPRAACLVWGEDFDGAEAPG